MTAARKLSRISVDDYLAGELVSPIKHEYVGGFVSKATRRIDEGEKKDAYLTIPSLAVYVLIEQEYPGVVAWCRAKEGVVREEYEGLDAVLPLPEIDIELPLAEIYETVQFAPET